MHVPSFEGYLDQIQALVGPGKGKNEGIGWSSIFFLFLSGIISSLFCNGASSYKWSPFNVNVGSGLPII